MRLGLYLNLYGTPDERPQLADAVEQARLAEQAGLEWIVLGELRLLDRVGQPGPLVRGAVEVQIQTQPHRGATFR